MGYWTQLGAASARRGQALVLAREGRFGSALSKVCYVSLVSVVFQIAPVSGVGTLATHWQGRSTEGYPCQQLQNTGLRNWSRHCLSHFVSIHLQNWALFTCPSHWIQISCGLGSQLRFWSSWTPTQKPTTKSTRSRPTEYRSAMSEGLPSFSPRRRVSR